MLKQYNVRLPVSDIKAIDNLGGCRSEHIRSAIRSYLQNDITVAGGDVYTIHLQDEICYLRKQNEVLMLSNLSWWARVKLKLLESRS